MKKKAEEIRKRSVEEKRKRNQEQKDRGRFISIPNSKHADLIADCLRSAGSNVNIVAGQKIENLTRPHTTKSRSKSVVYKIPCSGVCNKSYIGETGRGLITRMNEHK